MGKAKNPNTNTGVRVANRQGHARVSFLFQAATFLASMPANSDASGPARGSQHKDNSSDAMSIDETHEGRRRAPVQHSTSGVALSQYYSSHIATIARKGQLKLSRSVKRSLCKGCNVVLLSGTTCEHFVENASKAGLKPWADVLVVRCKLCGLEKRFPLQTKGDRRKRRDRTDAIVQSLAAT